jgi:hypothetical protein
VIKKFDASGKQEDIITIKVTPQAKKKCNEFELDTQSMKQCRLLKQSSCIHKNVSSA